MAQILDFNTPSVNPIGAPPNDRLRIQANPNMFGAQKGQAFEKLGGAFERVGQAATEVGQLNDRIDVDDQTNKFIDQRNKLLYGDPNNPNDRGFMGLEGRAAPDARAGMLQQLEEARQAGKSNLKNPMAQLAYDQQTRRIYQEAESHVGAHTDQQWKTWAAGVNAAGAGHELNDFVNSLDDPGKAQGFAHNYINFKVQQAQLKFGDDPGIKAEAEAEARRDLLQAHLNVVSIRDPDGALKILEANKNIAGTKYDDFYNRLRDRADAQVGSRHGESVWNKVTRGPIAAPAEIAGSVSSAWRAQGMSDNGIAGILFNIGEESSFNPTLRHPDQPRYAPSDERHYAHGLYQEGAEEWSRYENWIAATHPGADWRDHKLQSEFAAWNLKTNYPGVWQRMNAAATPEEAAAIYARDYLKPSAANLQSRLAKIGSGIAPASGYGGGPIGRASSGGIIAAPTWEERKATALRELMDDADLRDRPKAFAAAWAEVEKRAQIEHATAIDDDRAEKAAEKARNAQALAIEDEYLKDAYSPSPAKTAADVVNDPRLANDPAAKQKIISFYERANKPDPIAPISQATTRELFDRMRLPAGDPNKITNIGPINDAFSQGKLTRADHDWIANQFKNAETPEGERLQKRKAEFLKGVAPQIDQTDMNMGIKDLTGQERLYRFEWDLDHLMERDRQEGKNPWDRVDPTKPNYMGKPEALAPYKKTPEEIMAEWGSRHPAAPAAPEQPGFFSRLFSSTSTPPFNPASIKNLAELQAAFAARQVTPEQAQQIALDRGWGVRRAPAPPPQPMPRVPMSE